MRSSTDEICYGRKHNGDIVNLLKAAGEKRTDDSAMGGQVNETCEHDLFSYLQFTRDFVNDTST